MTVHISTDLETWGTRPGCDIRSIGACVFDPIAGTIADAVHYTDEETLSGGSGPGTFYIATDNPLSDEDKDADPAMIAIWDENPEQSSRPWKLHRDPSTAQWWSEQSDEAQAAFADPVDLKVALERFAEWFTRLAYPEIHIYTSPIFTPPTNIRIWAHGPQFDISILAAAYEAVGLPVPWHYRAPRDTRTAFDLAGIDDHSAWLKQHTGPLGVPHHALDDAICQARAVCAAYGRLRVPHDVVTHRSAWRSAIETAKEWDVSPDDPDRTYYDHELSVFDNTFDDLAAHPHTDK